MSLSFVQRAFAQDFNYVHYDVRDGLAGSTVYDMCQDKDGFMWFATENGLSRYDGSRFKNFTVADGLPDNEVLKIFADSKGRVWIGTFAKELCYYFKGNIYNKGNTKILHDIHFNGAVLVIAEDEKKNILACDFTSVYQISPYNTVTRVITPQNVLGQKLRRVTIIRFKGGGFAISTDDSTYRLFNNELKFYRKTSWFKSDKQFSLRQFNDSERIVLQSPDTRFGATHVDFTAVFVSTVNGAWSIDTFANKLDIHFLKGKRVSHSIYDTEGNIWFSTMGEGVFKLPSTEMRTISFAKTGQTDNTEVFSLEKIGGELLCGLGFSKAAMLKDDLPARLLNYESFTGKSTNNLATNRLYCSKALPTGGAVLGFDAYLARLYNNGNILMNNKLVAIKSIDLIDSGHILVGLYNHAYKVRTVDLAVVDTIWAGRCTKVLYLNKKYYIGTINGLYEVGQNKTFKYLGDLHPAFKRRVSDMKVAPDGTLWVATNDQGMVAYRDGKVVGELTERQGLSSNICKSLFVEGNYLWAGTNKGLNKIDIVSAVRPFPIVKYSFSDGLPSDVVNALYVEDSIIWVGSPVGVTYFNEKKISHTSLCSFQMLSATVSQRAVATGTKAELAYKDNNIKFEFTAISLKAAGDIVYHYRLEGLDTGWRYTRENVIDYPSLPSGDYVFRIYAVNKFGVTSKTGNVFFSIATPFYRKWWFFAVVLSVASALTGWVVNGRNKIARLKLVEKNNYQKQFAALEQQALQAQMNPHFIFNCLNSIQQYILTNDKEKANEYLTGFARLIRQTLDNSGKQSISVSEEVKYLTSYLEMEKMRFGDNFKYFVRLDASVVPDLILMPALLLQPYIENALRHGIRYKQDGYGMVVISFSIKNDKLVCNVEDNGIGRQKAGEFKSRQHIEYQSKGMSLTEKRIELLNKLSDRKITVEITDLMDESGNAGGTKVVVSIPV